MKQLLHMFTALVVLLSLGLANGGASVPTKTVEALSDPFIVDPLQDYLAGGAVMADANGVATFTDDLLWYDGTGDGTPSESPVSTTGVASGSATTNFSDNVWERRVTPPGGTKYARRKHSATVNTGGGHKVTWGPVTWRDAPGTLATVESSLPMFSHDGEIHFSLDGELLRRGESLGWEQFGPLWHFSDGTVVDVWNTDGTGTRLSDKNVRSLQRDPLAGVNVAGWWTAIDAYNTLTVALMPQIYDEDFQRYGLFVSTVDGSHHAPFAAFSIGHNGSPVMEALSFTDESTLASVDLSAGFSQTGLIWLRLTETAPNIFDYSWSRDKVFWNLFATGVDAGAILGTDATHWGIFVDVNNGTWGLQVTVLSVEAE